MRKEKLVQNNNDALIVFQKGRNEIEMGIFGTEPESFYYSISPLTMQQHKLSISSGSQHWYQNLPF